MNYNVNEQDWEVGDFVIHDADAKTSKMLMKVIGKRLITYNNGIKKVMYETIYINSPEYNTERWINPKEFLHSPLHFGIKVSERLEK